MTPIQKPIAPCTNPFPAPPSHRIATRLQQTRQQIQEAEIEYNRPHGAVQLLAVSKTKPASDIAIAYQAGQRHFGENYCQEAIAKQKQLGAYAICWHFIGPIQSNKTRPIAEHFDWVHSVENLKIAKRLNDQRPAHLPPLNIALQVNISDETSKSGMALDALAQVCWAVQALPRLVLRGVMAIPEPETDFAKQRIPYRRLVQAVGQIDGIHLDTFSFGMSGDLQAAIAEGSTLVRIGTAIFGRRSSAG